MDQDDIIAALVGEYIPRDAVNLRPAQRRMIIQDLYGVVVSDPQLQQEILGGNLSALTKDPSATAAYLKQLAAEGVIFTRRELVGYLTALQGIQDEGHYGVITSVDAVVARYPRNWTKLRERLGDEGFLEALQQAGTWASYQQYKKLSESPVDNWQHYRAALLSGDVQLMNYLVTDEQYFMITEGRVANLHPVEVKALITYNPRMASELLESYYKQGYTNNFLYYMSLLTYNNRQNALAKILTKLLEDTRGRGESTMVTILYGRATKAYRDAYPNDEVSQELRRLDVVGIKQLLKPTSTSDYSKQRGPLYQLRQTRRSLQGFLLNHSKVVAVEAAIAEMQFKPEDLDSLKQELEDLLEKHGPVNMYSRCSGLNHISSRIMLLEDEIARLHREGYE